MKIKPLTKEQIITAVDRLTRFKEPESKYLRVFYDVIINNLIEPKFKKSELYNIDYVTIREYAQSVINYSIKCILNNYLSDDYLLNKKILDYESSVFNLTESAKELINNKISYFNILNFLPLQTSENLNFLKLLAGIRNSSCLYPVKKLILCEGITEEILLPKFASVYGYDFTEHGVYIQSAGGKNQVVKYFYNYVNCLKIPIFVLLDRDADENYKQILPKLRNFDKIHILHSGEFEDLLSDSLINRTLSYTTRNISNPMDNINDYSSVVDFLNEFYRTRGLHEFKKSDFALAVKLNILDKSDISDEIAEIFEELKIL